jgi:putative oxidoreductase
MSGASVLAHKRHIGGLGDVGMSLVQRAFSLLARLFLATLFLVEGYGKITGYGDVVAYMTSHHVPAGLLPVVILTELAGGLCIALGCLTRPVAFAMAGFTLLTALFFHADFSDPDQLIHFLKNIAIAGGFFSLVASGAGPWSLDALLFARGWSRADPQEARP